MIAVHPMGLRALFALFALTALVPPAAAQQGSPPHWTYEGEHGPAHWGGLDSAYAACQVGKEQSPIDIRHAKVADLPPIRFSYQPSTLLVIDNGHTIQVNYAPGSFITVGDQRYELEQFHFHHPSEEKVDGKSYPLVAHLVHKNAQGNLAVVAVLLTNGHANRLLESVWRHLPAEKGKEIAPAGVTIDATALLPASRGYYTFPGSLTTPPCTQGVTWFVFKSPVQVSEDQVASFAQRYPHNARPVQPLNGRAVLTTP